MPLDMMVGGLQAAAGVLFGSDAGPAVVAPTSDGVADGTMVEDEEDEECREKDEETCVLEDEECGEVCEEECGEEDGQEQQMEEER